MAKPSIYLNSKYQRTDGKCALYLRLYINNDYLLIPLDLHVEEENWDMQSKSVKAGKNKRTINRQLEEAVGRASDIILKYQVQKMTLTKERFEKEFSNPELLIDFYAFAREMIKSREGELTKGSINLQMAVINKMQTFRKELLIVEIDEKFLRAFEKHLRLKLDNKQNTVYNAYKTIKYYVSAAKRQGLIKNNPFDYYRVKKHDTVPEFLTKQDRDRLMQLYNSNQLPDTYRNVLRWFLFSCYTGLRISDIRSIMRKQITDDKHLRFYPVKTRNVNNLRVDIPLTKTALQLIADENSATDMVFNCISDQKMNQYIKEVVKVAKITSVESISFHTARHTFATLFLQSTKAANGIIILQKLLGHANIAQTMKYSHVLSTDIDAAMFEFDG